MDWKEIRRKVKREEKIFVFIILGIIIVSIIDEVIAKSGYAFLFVLNYESVSLVVIQIQANDIIFDSRTQSYLYEVTNNIPIEFNKDELLQYLHDRRKIVNIVLYISVHKEEGKIGNLLVTEN